MADDIALLGGFRQPVFDAQATFRLLMTAMAQPGSRHVVTAEVSAPDGLGLARTALVLTLVDADAPVWLTAPTPRLAAWLAFHTGARLVADTADAAFALVDRGAALPAGLSRGTQDYPDRSATLVLEVDGFGHGDTLQLEGPGIDGRRTLAVAGLPAGFAELVETNRTLFPLGLDVVLTAGAELCALPRSTRVVVSEG